MTKKTILLKYKPVHVRLPENIKKDFSQSIWKSQLKNKQQPTYDDYSLFYDVFFDIARKNIWTVGPPLFSVEDKILPMRIFYQGKEIPHKYYLPNHGQQIKYSYFQIPASHIKEKNPKLTFTGKGWEINVQIATFPTSNHSQATLAVLQKDYSAKHIIEWILWHYRIYNFKRILFYDNNSDNALEVQKSIENLNIPELEIIFIEWHYFYGTSPKHDDLFAQSTQLNHRRIQPISATLSFKK